MDSGTRSRAAPDDGGVDYASYTDLELQEALAGIRADRYPLNYSRLVAELGNRPAGAPDDVEHAFDVGDPEPVTPAGPYVPNEVSLEDRLKMIGTAAALLAYGAYGAWRGDLYVPGKHGGGMHLHGDGARLAFAAICFSAVATIARVLDHYDRRNNETVYRRVATTANWIALMLFLVAVFRDFRAY